MTFNCLFSLPGKHLLLLCALVVIHRASTGTLQSLVTRLFERFFKSCPSLHWWCFICNHKHSVSLQVRHIARPTLKIRDAAISKPFLYWQRPLGWHAIYHMLEQLPQTQSKKLWKIIFLHNLKVTSCLQTAVISKRRIRFERAWRQMKDFSDFFIKLT